MKVEGEKLEERERWDLPSSHRVGMTVNSSKFTAAKTEYCYGQKERNLLKSQ